MFEFNNTDKSKKSYINIEKKLTFQRRDTTKKYF